MKRKTFRAVVTDESGNTIIGERDTFAWNSAIRATEAIMRDYARENVGPCAGGKPVVMESEQSGSYIQTGRIYRRIWTAATGRTFRALVWEVV